MASDSTNYFCRSQILDGPERVVTGVAGTRAALHDPDKWPAGSIIKVRFLDGDASLQDRVRAVAEQWIEPGINLTFSWVSKGLADIRIRFVQGDGSWSYLGTYCRAITDPDQHTMNFGWLSSSSTDEQVKSVVLHEFGHALGLIHEHQNPNGAIEWDEEAVVRDLSGPPNNWSREQIVHNVLKRYPPNQVVDSTAVDATSIMMYPIPASWTRGKFTAGFNTDRSALDRELIRKCYG